MAEKASTAPIAGVTKLRQQGLSTCNWRNSASRKPLFSLRSGSSMQLADAMLKLWCHAISKAYRHRSSMSSAWDWSPIDCRAHSSLLTYELNCEQGRLKVLCQASSAAMHGRQCMRPTLYSSDIASSASVWYGE